NKSSLENITHRKSALSEKKAENLIVENEVNSSIISEFSEIQDRTNVIKYLPRNYSTKGDVDYTDYVQKAIYQNKEVILPNFAIGINYEGLIIPSNRKIVFQQHSKLKLIANDKKKYHILFISGVENVEIVNPHIEGDRKEVEMNHGEWGMGISIISSKNVSITNCNIYNCRGDGIYISRDEKLNIIPENVSIKGGLLHNNRRNGVSIISAND